MSGKEVYYGDYLQLDKILSAQQPESELNGKEAHDEMLFIIVHQAYELWFKQIKHEMESIISILNKPIVNDNSPDIFTVVHRLKRIATIWELAVHQVDVIETMTPLDFLDFRDQLRPASGFQSFQFKMLEAMMGLRYDERQGQDFYNRNLRTEHIEAIAAVESGPSLISLVRTWLERMPFFDTQYWPGAESNMEARSHPFWKAYVAAFAETLSTSDKNAICSFDQSFFLPQKEGKNRLTTEANRAILFIMLYRDYPLLQIPFQLLDTLIEIDELMATWRTRHIAMVHRMIGARSGTGGSSGAEYLKKSRDKHLIFNEIADINSFLIQREKLPELSVTLESRLGYRSE